MRLTEKVLEHGLNSTAVHGVPAGCGHWICVRKKREKRERKTKRDREKETRQRTARDWTSFFPRPVWPSNTPQSKVDFL